MNYYRSFVFEKKLFLEFGRMLVFYDYNLVLKGYVVNWFFTILGGIKSVFSFEIGFLNLLWERFSNILEKFICRFYFFWRKI